MSSKIVFFSVLHLAALNHSKIKISSSRNIVLHRAQVRVFTRPHKAPSDQRKADPKSLLLRSQFKLLLTVFLYFPQTTIFLKKELTSGDFKGNRPVYHNENRIVLATPLFKIKWNQANFRVRLFFFFFSMLVTRFFF